LLVTEVDGLRGAIDAIGNLGMKHEMAGPGCGKILSRPDVLLRDPICESGSLLSCRDE